MASWRDAPIVEVPRTPASDDAPPPRPAWESAPIVEEAEATTGGPPAPVDQPAEPQGIVAQIRDLFTGDSRETRATRELPELPGSAVLRDAGLSPAAAARLAAVLLVTPDPAEAARIIRAASPDLAIAQDERGNLIVANNRTGRQAVLNKPGMSEMDLLQAGGTTAAFAPVGAGGLAGGLGRAAVRIGGQSAAVQTGIEAAQAASGGEFNPGEVVLAGGVGAAVPPAAVVAEKAAGAVARGAERVIDRVRGAAPGGPATPTPGTFGSAGAAGTDMATQRRTVAESMPEPIRLTEGQATRDQAQLRFEIETAKDPVQGARLRARSEEQNAAILKNFDAFVDDTGAQAPDIASTGRTVVDALTKRASQDKAAIRAAYKEAEKAGELRAPVATNPVVELLNASTSAESVAPVLRAAKAELQRLGGATDAGGVLVPQEMSLHNMEMLRRFVNRATGADPTNVKYAGDIKRAIDAATEGAGGDLYAKARAMRAKFAEQYEDRAIVADLLTNRRNMADPKVAIDQVFNRTILRGSPDEIRFLRDTLTNGGDDGAQAWRELQGATLNHLREQATRNVTTNQRGDPVVSAAGLDRAVKQLDKNGRLDIVLGKQRAQMVRDLNEIAKYVNTAPPGTVNTSNTASVILGALAEVGTLGAFAGLPVPVLTGLRMLSRHMKDRAVATRVSQALGEATKRETKKAARDAARAAERERAALRAMEQDNQQGGRKVF